MTIGGGWVVTGFEVFVKRSRHSEKWERLGRRYHVQEAASALRDLALRGGYECAEVRSARGTEGHKKGK